jgi:hypothetical protein
MTSLEHQLASILQSIEQARDARDALALAALLQRKDTIAQHWLRRNSRARAAQNMRPARSYSAPEVASRPGGLIAARSWRLSSILRAIMRHGHRFGAGAPRLRDAGKMGSAREARGSSAGRHSGDRRTVGIGFPRRLPSPWRQVLRQRTRNLGRHRRAA